MSCTVVTREAPPAADESGYTDPQPDIMQTEKSKLEVFIRSSLKAWEPPGRDGGKTVEVKGDEGHQENQLSRAHMGLQRPKQQALNLLWSLPGC